MRRFRRPPVPDDADAMRCPGKNRGAPRLAATIPPRGRKVQSEPRRQLAQRAEEAVKRQRPVALRLLRSLGSRLGQTQPFRQTAKRAESWRNGAVGLTSCQA